MKEGKYLVILVIVVILLAAFFTGVFGKKESPLPEDNIVPEDTIETGDDFGDVLIDESNPASVHCRDQGGRLVIESFESGQRGFCFFDDGSRCEEWDLYHGNCGRGQLKVEVLEEGTGKMADNESVVAVHYTGMLEDGTKFDSSLDRGWPFIFALGRGEVIKGWDQGVLGMKVGEKRRLVIAPELGYGQTGAGGAIPPNATLIFEVEMVEME